MTIEGVSRGYAARNPFRTAKRNVDNTGLPKDVWMNRVNASSVLLDPATGWWFAGSWICHRASAELLLLWRIVLPSFVTWTLSLVKVAMQPLLQSSEILSRDVPSAVSANMYARKGV